MKTSWFGLPTYTPQIQHFWESHLTWALTPCFVPIPPCGLSGLPGISPLLHCGSLNTPGLLLLGVFVCPVPRYLLTCSLPLGTHSVPVSALPSPVWFLSAAHISSHLACTPLFIVCLPQLECTYLEGKAICILCLMQGPEPMTVADSSRSLVHICGTKAHQNGRSNSQSSWKFQLEALG